MATSLPSLTPHTTGIPTDVTCPICMEKYSLNAAQNPVMLPNCGHTICRCCLTSIHKASQTENVCPICRAPFNGPNPKYLPANFLVLSIMQAHLDFMEDISSTPHKKISPASADRNSELRVAPTSTSRTATSISIPRVFFPRSTSHESSPNKSQDAKGVNHITFPVTPTQHQQYHRPGSPPLKNSNTLNNQTLDSSVGRFTVKDAKRVNHITLPMSPTQHQQYHRPGSPPLKNSNTLNNHTLDSSVDRFTVKNCLILILVLFFFFGYVIGIGYVFIYVFNVFISVSIILFMIFFSLACTVIAIVLEKKHVKCAAVVYLVLILTVTVAALPFHLIGIWGFLMFGFSCIYLRFLDL